MAQWQWHALSIPERWFGPSRLTKPFHTFRRVANWYWRCQGTNKGTRWRAIPCQPSQRAVLRVYG